MPKKIVEPDVIEEEEFEEDEEDEDEDELEVEMPKKKRVGKKKRAQPEEEPKKRYTAFNNPQRVGIADAETGEVVAEGEYAIFQSLADIMERLERIENNTESMLEG